MNSSDYNKYSKMIDAANDLKDVEMLKKIKSLLYKNHDIDDPDIERLINKFKFHA